VETFSIRVIREIRGRSFGVRFNGFIMKPQNFLWRLARSGTAWLFMGGASVVLAADTAALQTLLQRSIIGPGLALAEVQAFTESRVPLMPPVKSAAEWEKLANRLRRDTLARVVYRGEAVAWRDARTKVEWLGTVAGGPGYHIRKLRFEALPGWWIPALLYEPDTLAGAMPANLLVNGHDANGNQAPYKQIRAINLAKRGMLALNLEWLGMGQLSGTNYLHYRMNQLDLCGTSGVSPFYLAMKRGLDILLAHPNADPNRVSVSGLSGGGWQTIFISSLDTRVKLTNPVAGYSSFRTRARFLSDLGDSEQTPCDLATVADYAQLTAMMAPRSALLTFNAMDNCCFAAGHALPPLLDAARPIFQLYHKDANLRSHVNLDPGTHNYEKDNREAFYRMVGDSFYAGDARYPRTEIPSETEVKTGAELHVQMPAENADFNKLARALSKHLPRHPEIPTGDSALRKWQSASRAKLRAVVKARDYSVTAQSTGSETRDGLTATFWQLKLSQDWTVPVVELVRGEPKGTTLLVADAGRGSVAAEAGQLLDAGQRVLAVDPFYFGESKIAQRDFLFALLVGAVGERPLGLQASQLAAVARWSQTERSGGPVAVLAVGPRTSTFTLVAAGLEDKAIGNLELRGALGSLKTVIEQDWSVDQKPELFCFGLLEAFDIKQLTALVGPRTVAAR
jgi:hypothetical protein